MDIITGADQTFLLCSLYARRDSSGQANHASIKMTMEQDALVVTVDSASTQNTQMRLGIGCLEHVMTRVTRNTVKTQPVLTYRQIITSVEIPVPSLVLPVKPAATRTISTALEIVCTLTWSVTAMFNATMEKMRTSKCVKTNGGRRRLLELRLLLSVTFSTHQDLP